MTCSVKGMYSACTMFHQMGIKNNTVMHQHTLVQKSVCCQAIPANLECTSSVSSIASAEV